MSFNDTFNQSSNVLIGAIHLPSLLGYPHFPGFGTALKNALIDLEAFEKGGMNAVIFENNYDLPHKARVDESVISSLTYLGDKIKQATNLPLGISVLWNDYRSALAIAKVLDLQFVRVPVFVDTVKTDYGLMVGQPEDVVRYRASIGADKVALLTDIHVKHAELVSNHSLTESAGLAVKHGSDAIILTGKWTGDAPGIQDLQSLRREVGDFPVLIGSGVDENNARDLFEYANGAIVSTSLKQGSNKIGEVNVKGYEQRIDQGKVKKLTDSLFSGLS
ncbi:MAG TPA: BtpA/SgcQ family protein [bacterium]|nr:MAG: putative sgc region protein SgcQ [Parcubacteria group bacterium ADurb.Bin192]HPN15001.1 BtpA/SgcQ family protein [bacterium]